MRTFLAIAVAAGFMITPAIAADASHGQPQPAGDNSQSAQLENGNPAARSTASDNSNGASDSGHDSEMALPGPADQNPQGSPP
jgi:hypothetical protein